MSSPTTPSTGYTAQGTTTIVFGTDTLWSTYIVTRIAQKDLIENIKLQNGTGITSTRVQLKDGVQWDVTVRDDTGMTPPRSGNTVTIKDAGGLIGNVGLSYTARVVESAWDSAPKQAAERSFTAENLVLIESQTGA